MCMTNGTHSTGNTMMNVTPAMFDAMYRLAMVLSDTLDDDYPNVRDDILSEYEMTDEQNDYCANNYLTHYLDA